MENFKNTRGLKERKVGVTLFYYNDRNGIHVMNLNCIVTYMAFICLQYDAAGYCTFIGNKVQNIVNGLNPGVSVVCLV